MGKRLLALAVMVLTCLVLASEACPSDQGFDCVLLMDSSGSMKKTDPHSYRKDAARLFISLLGPEDKIGIVSFGDSAKTLIPLTANTVKNRPALLQAAGRITSRELSTDITGAVKKGVEDLRSSGGKNKALILMSDGKLALGDPKKDEASLAELMKILPELKEADIRIYTIAFSEMSDPKLLGEMAEKTGGIFRYAAADKDIHLMFESIFEKIKSPDSIALQGDAFNVDKDVKEAVLIITKQAGTSTYLIDPSGRKNIQGRSVKNIKWFSSSVFDMITVQEPEAGKWKVRLSSHEGNRVFVLTNLKLKSSFEKNALSSGDVVKVDAWLEKDDKRITEKEVLGQVLFYAEVVGSDGKGIKVPLSAKPAPDEGVYSGEFRVGQAGDYSLKLLAEGKTFNRAKDLFFKVTEPPAIAKPKAVEQAPEAAQPKTNSADQIDWLKTGLLLGFSHLLLLSLAVFLYIRARKYKRLYLSAGKPDAGSVVETSETETPTSDQIPPTESSAEAVPEVIPPEVSAETESTEGAPEEKPAEAAVVSEITAAEEPAPPGSDRIRRLEAIIEFQRKRIADLMMVKDVIENAGQKLSPIPERSRGMIDKLRAAGDSHGLGDEVGGPVSALEDDTGELVSYIAILQKEGLRLNDKFIQWEQDLQKLMEDAEYAPPEFSAAEAPGSDRVAELEARIVELEDQLMSKDRKIKAVEQQYEDIEKEYMILYHAAQKQKQQQPEV